MEIENPGRFNFAFVDTARFSRLNWQYPELNLKLWQERKS
jgi:hypothetical protein